jgi:hypothetical protein
MDSFYDALQRLINTFSQENASNTPDYILAQYMLACLDAFTEATQQRETWYGRDARPFYGEFPETAEQLKEKAL